MVCVCVCENTLATLIHGGRGGQRTTYRGQLSSSATQILGTELGSSSAGKFLYPLSHLAGPTESFLSKCRFCPSVLGKEWPSPDFSPIFRPSCGQAALVSSH